MSVCNLHMSSVVKEGCSYDSDGAILNPSDFLSHEDQGQMLGPELNLAAQISGCEYTHLQHLIQTHMETNESDIPEQNTALVKNAPKMSPLSTTQAIDLSTSSDGHDVVLLVEKTPPCYGEVPGFVLAKIRAEDSSAALADNTSQSSQSRGPCTARVCLEERFNSVASMGPEDPQSAALCKSLAVFQQSTEAQDGSSHPSLQKWIRPEKINEMPGSYLGIYTPMANICGKVIHQVSYLEPNPQQGFNIPKRVPLNLLPEMVLENNNFASAINQPEDKMTPPRASRKHQRAKSKTSKEIPESAVKPGSSVIKRLQQVVPTSLRREKHNNKERERRRKIRLCCDELNMLVPFCQTDTDKVTTLQWTAAYLRYVKNIYGDKIKEEFQRIFADKNGLKPNPSTVNSLILHNTENIPMAVEP